MGAPKKTSETNVPRSRYFNNQVTVEIPSTPERINSIDRHPFHIVVPILLPRRMTVGELYSFLMARNEMSTNSSTS